MWPTSGQIGCITLAVWGFPNASMRGKKPQGAHKQADWLRHPCRLVIPEHLNAGHKIRSGLEVRGLAISPLPSGGSAMLPCRGQKQKWPTSGRIGYITLAIWGFLNASMRGTKSQAAQEHADWLHYPCYLGGAQRFNARDKIRNGPKKNSGLAIRPLPLGGSPMLQCGGQNQKWPTSGWIGYITQAVGESPTVHCGGENHKGPTSG